MKTMLQVFLAIFVFTISACTEKKGRVLPMTPMEAMGQIANDFAVLIDVREAEELEKTGIAEPARWIPLSKIKSGAPEWKTFLETHPKDKAIAVYCEAGGRAQVVAQDLSQRGFQTSNIGGLKDWKKAGLPTKPWRKR